MYPAPAPPHLNSLKLISYSLASFWVDFLFMIHNKNFVCISHLAQMWPLYPSLTLCPLHHNSYIIILSQVLFMSTSHQSFSKFTNIFDCLTLHCLLKVQDFVLNDEVLHAKKAHHVSEVTASFVLNLGIRSRWMVSVKFWPLYPLNRRLGGPQGQSRRFAEQKNLLPLTWISLFQVFLPYRPKIKSYRMVFWYNKEICTSVTCVLLVLLYFSNTWL